MPDDALVEQLARQLGYVYRKAAGWDHPEVHRGDRDTETERDRNANRLLWEVVARECLRQMEWARRQAMDECVTNVADGARRIGSDYRMEILDYGWFTLAPPEWKP